jgi:hypothetical protein
MKDLKSILFKILEKRRKKITVCLHLLALTKIMIFWAKKISLKDFLMILLMKIRACIDKFKEFI